MKDKIVIYQPKDGEVIIDVKIEDETVWLSQAQLVDLFETTKQNISLHINNCFKEGELSAFSVVKESLTTASDGKKYKLKYYNLDVIISVGYRVKSQRGTQFRIWANKVLKDYLIQGYTINEKRLQAKSQQLEDLKKAVELQEKVLAQYPLANEETHGLIKVIASYSRALDILDDYDHQRLQIPEREKKDLYKITYEEAKKAIDELGRQTQFQGLFGKEKDDSFKSSLNTIYQTFDGIDLYPSTEEKAANLLYFIVKNHSFTDGNKRIAAFLFVHFLNQNRLLATASGRPKISNEALVALTLMIAESHPEDKDMMVKVIVNLLIDKSEL